MAKEEETTRTPEDKHPRDEKASEPHEDHEDESDADEEEDEGDEAGEDEDEDEDEEAEEEAAKAKAVAAPEAKPAAKDDASSRGAAARARPRPVRAAPPPPPPATNLGARVIVFVAVLGVLSAGFWLLSGFDSGLDKPAITWRVGQVVDMDITLVKEDATNLGCASSQVIAGKKCEFSSRTDKNADLTDATMLKPYTTTDGVNFVAAGLWTQAAISKGKLPNDRFSIHCKYKVEGMLKTPLVRWNPTAQWGEKKEDWYAGTVSDCKLNPP